VLNPAARKERVQMSMNQSIEVCPYAIWLNNHGITDLVGTAVAQWLGYCATNQKVAGLISDGVIGIFH
jgi:hypothetical protein